MKRETPFKRMKCDKCGTVDILAEPSTHTLYKPDPKGYYFDICGGTFKPINPEPEQLILFEGELNGK